MAATDHLPTRRHRRRWLLIVPLLVAGLAGMAYAVGRPGIDVPPLPPMPKTDRSDVAVEATARRHQGRLVVDVELTVAADGAALTVTHWSRGQGGGPLEWVPSVVTEVLPDGQVVVHLGTGSPQRDPDVYEYVLPAPVDHTVDANGLLVGSATFDPTLDQRGDGALEPVGASRLDALDEVRICVWEAGAEPPPGGRPAACVDTEVDRRDGR